VELDVHHQGQCGFWHGQRCDCAPRITLRQDHRTS
jgi:hypothetical protein